MEPRKRLKLVQALAQLYPEPRSELDFSNEFELIIAVILSAQCTDVKVNQVTAKLFKRYPTPERLARAKLTEVEQIIRPINYYKTKSKELTELPGVGRKTANVVLGELGVIPTLAVDTHVFRVSHRLGLSVGKTPDKVEEDLKQQFPASEWRALHHRLIFHGRRVCKARQPNCQECSLSKLCLFGQAR
jgi:endonuclease-3